MTTHMVTVRDTATAAEALEEIRRQAEEVEDFYQVFVVDADRRLVGILPFKDLVISRPERPVRDFMDDGRHLGRARAGPGRSGPADGPVQPAQRRRWWTSSGRLLGRVTFDDVIDVVEAETTEDLLALRRRLRGRGARRPAGRTRCGAGCPGSTVNLLTAFLAGGVVYLFQDTVQRTVALAVWMPIIAGMGGNAGTQALAVTVRRLALGLIPVHLFARVVGKEILVGITNGLAIGRRGGHRRRAASGEGPALGLVVFLAMSGQPAGGRLRRRLHPGRCSSASASIPRSPRRSS